MHLLEAMWPSLPLDAWRNTKETLHRYTQIVGKIQLGLTPMVNQFWNVTLRLTARGLATSALPFAGGTFDIEFDFIEHCVFIRTSNGRQAQLELRPIAVADFHRELMAALDSLGIDVHIWDQPVELKADAIPFTEDRMHASYDRDYVERFFHVLGLASSVLDKFRARFTGKCSGVGFYWGTFDLSVARYSGRAVPDPRSAASIIEREAYSHEVSEVGFWPGDAVFPEPAFFALHYPAPDGYTRATLRPSAARWAPDSNCFVLPYQQVRELPDPATTILEFCQSTYEAGATLADWNRTELERQEDTMPANDSHLSAAHHVEPRTDGCEECLKLGMEWVHLRVCLSCGHIGCCDSSEGKHATKHFHTTKHPIVESFEPGEDWGWCYVHADFVELPRELLVDKR